MKLYKEKLIPETWNIYHNGKWIKVDKKKGGEIE